MLGSIVCLGSAVLGDRYGHFIRYRSDAQFTFVLLDLIVAVLVCFCLFNLDAVDYRALRYIGHASGCLCSCLTFYKTVSGNCYFRFGQRFSVVNLAGSLTTQFYRSRGDRKRSVYSLNAVVVSCIHYCVLSDLIVSCNGVFHVGHASGYHCRYFIAGRKDVFSFCIGCDLCSVIGYRIASVTVGTSVIHPAIAGCCDHNGFLAGGYRQGSRNLCDRVVAFFVAFSFGNLNGIGYRFSCIKSASGCLCSCFSFYKTVSAYCYIRSGQRSSVVNLAGSLTGQDYRSRADRKLSVFDLEGYLCKVGVVVCEIFRFQLHVVASGVDSLHFCVSAEGEVCFFIQRIADALHNVTSRTMLDSVVCCTSAVLGDRYGHFIRYRSDTQFAFVLLDLIVAVFVCCCLFDLDGIGYRALRHVGHTSGCLCSCLTFYKTVSGDCYIRSGQRFSVISFAVTYTGQGYRSRGDLHICRDHFGFPVLRFH